MIDQAEREGLSGAQRQHADDLAAMTAHPVSIAGRLGDEWAILMAWGPGTPIGDDPEPTFRAVHRDGRTFDTAGTWAESLLEVAEPPTPHVTGSTGAGMFHVRVGDRGYDLKASSAWVAERKAAELEAKRIEHADALQE